MRSGNAHCDLELTNEVGQFPLRSAAGDDEARGARGGGRGRRRRRRRRRRRARVTLIKSSNPHLAGGEKVHVSVYVYHNATTIPLFRQAMHTYI